MNKWFFLSFKKRRIVDPFRPPKKKSSLLRLALNLIQTIEIRNDNIMGINYPFLLFNPGALIFLCDKLTFSQPLFFFLCCDVNLITTLNTISVSRDKGFTAIFAYVFGDCDNFFGKRLSLCGCQTSEVLKSVFNIW